MTDKILDHIIEDIRNEIPWYYDMTVEYNDCTTDLIFEVNLWICIIIIFLFKTSITITVKKEGEKFFVSENFRDLYPINLSEIWKEIEFYKS